MVVRCTDGFRQAIQPGALAAYRAAGDHLDDVCPAWAAPALALVVGALLCAVPAGALGGAWLWLAWPAVSLALVALTYGVLGAGGFQKGADGGLSPAACWLLAPYLIGTWGNSRLWTWCHPQADEVCDGVYLGRIPGRGEGAQFTAVIDLCAELPCTVTRPFAPTLSAPAGQAAPGYQYFDPGPDSSAQHAAAPGRHRHRTPALPGPRAGLLRLRLLSQRQRRSRLAGADRPLQRCATGRSPAAQGPPRYRSTPRAPPGLATVWSTTMNLPVVASLLTLPLKG